MSKILNEEALMEDIGVEDLHFMEVACFNKKSKLL